MCGFLHMTNTFFLASSIVTSWQILTQTVGVNSLDHTYDINLNFTCYSVAGPAGPALAGPLFSGALVSFPDRRDSLRMRRLGQVSTQARLALVYAFLLIVSVLLPAVRSPERPDRTVSAPTCC